MKSKLMPLTLTTLLAMLVFSYFVAVSQAPQRSSTVGEVPVIVIDGDLSDWAGITPVATDPVGDTFQWSKNATILSVGSTAEKPGMVTGNVTKNDMCRDLKALYFVSDVDKIYMRLDVAGLYPGWNNTSTHGPLTYANLSYYMINFDFATGGYLTAIGILEELNHTAGNEPDFYFEWDGNSGAIAGDAQRDNNNWDLIISTTDGGIEVATNIAEGAFEFSFDRSALEGFFGLPIGETHVWAMSYKPGEPTGGIMPTSLRRLFDPQAPGTPGECQKEWGGLPDWPNNGSEYTWTDPWGVGHKLTTSPAVKGMDAINAETGQPITLTYPIPIDFADIFGNNLDAFTWAPGSWRDLRATLNPEVRVAVDLSSGAVRDVAVTSVVPSLTEVTIGELVNVTVIVKNNGSVAETFDVTAYYDATKIGKKTVTDLEAGDTETLTFTWNTTGLTAGNYTIKAVAETLSGETNSANNALTYGQVKVKEEVVGPTGIPWMWIGIGVVVAVIIIAAAYMLTRKKPA